MQSHIYVKIILAFYVLCYPIISNKGKFVMSNIIIRVSLLRLFFFLLTILAVKLFAVCVRACVRACVRVSVRACGWAGMRACVCVCVCSYAAMCFSASNLLEGHLMSNISVIENCYGEVTMYLTCLRWPVRR